MADENSRQRDQELKHIVDSTVESIEKIIQDIKSASEAVPTLTQTLEYAKWSQIVLHSLPDEALSSINGGVADSFRNAGDYWRTVQNKISMVDTNTAAASGSAMNGTSSVELYQTVRVSAKSPGLQSWAEPLLAHFSKIQDDQDIKGKISARLGALAATIESEFKEASGSVEHVKAGTLTYSKAAISMRNVLEQLRGWLYLKSPKAQRISKKKKMEKWNEMAKDLATNGVGSLEYTTLLREGSKHMQLHDELSRIAKIHIVPTLGDFHNLSIRYFGHLYSVLNLLDARKM